MERTLSGDDESPAEAERPLEDGEMIDVAIESGSDLTDATFIDEFEEQEGLYRVKYDSVQATPSFAVITIVSDFIGRDPLELDPLCESIDSDALDALFTGVISSVSRLTFQYSGCEITVGTDDIVEVVSR